MNDNETTADVIAAMRDLEAAHKREKAAIEAYALEIGGIVGATAEKSSAVGDAAKLREALDKARRFIDSSPLVSIVDDTGTIARDELCAEIDAALAAPATAEKSSAVGDAAELREAVEVCLHAFQTTDWTTLGTSGRVVDLIQRCKSALAAPPRNCDVGSVAEQKERFKDFCKEGKLSRIDLGAYCAYDCPCRDSYDCKLEWAQMPYRKRVPNAE